MEKKLEWLTKNKIPVLVIIFAFITNLSITVFNGLHVCIKGECGLYIGNLHYHDFFWHFALAQNAFNSFPFSLPIYSGSTLTGYNYLIDIALFLLTKVGIPVIESYFQILPVLYLCLVSYLSYIYLKNRKKDPLYIAAGLFFVFFGSSFSYILSLYHFHTWRSFTYAQAMQSGRALLNMPHALSLPVLLGAMIILQKEKLGIKKMLLLGVLLFLMFGLKFYGGAVLLALILISRLIVWVRKFNFMIPVELAVYGAGCLAAYFIFYRTASYSGVFPFVFSPFSIAHPLIEERDMFYMPSLVNARYFLAATKTFSPRLLGIELLTALIFLVYNFGSRLIGFLPPVARIFRKGLSRSDISIMLTICISITVTLLFVQKQEWWNIIQFLGYALFLMNFFAGEALYYLLKSRNKVLLALGIIVILSTLPSNIEQISYAGERHISISGKELEALDFLRKQPRGTVLALPLQETSYVGAIAEKPLYIADKTQLYLLGIDYEKRMEGIIKMNSLSFDIGKVSYIYFHKEEKDSPVPAVPDKYRQVYENGKTVIYRKK